MKGEMEVMTVTDREDDMYECIFEYIKEHDNTIWAGDDPSKMYLLSLLAEEKEGLVIKSMCDEGGHIVRGNGFVYVTVNTNYGGSFYKFLLPTEYWSNIKCKRGIPFINEALNSDEWFIPLARVERDD